eukprot:TRINITY_DN858_c0_g1_i3.p1 TRINITY_DN858_c0_g1~~TRINITY_DN858_c0_g1_i3.p1  ORF type:complete len:294 (-),score=45.85 TRINITY_DN858_c0_g1_i3:62-901(-)
MRFASICSRLVLLHVGQGYRLKFTMNMRKALSNMQERGRESQKDAAAKESHVDGSILPRTRRSHEGEHSFADLSRNSSGAQVTHSSAFVSPPRVLAELSGELAAMLSTLQKLFWPERAQGSAASFQQPAVEGLGAQRGQPRLRDVKAEDYPTPDKYLEGAEIPTYYQFQSNLVADEDLKPGMVRNLEVDKRLTLPTRTHIRFLVTGQDVLHSWSVPALGVKTDATPGRINRITTFIQREGVFYGQCSELCGTLHGFMPIVVEAVAPEVYAAHARKWYKE